MARFSSQSISLISFIVVRMNKFTLSIVCLSFMLCASCNRAPAPIPRAPVAGKVVGEKLDGLGIVFSESTTSESIPLNSDGTFTGEAPVGDCVVYIYGAPNESASPDTGHADPKSSGIKAAFWDAEKTPWKTTITAEGVTDLEFSLDAKVAADPGSSHGGR